MALLCAAAARSDPTTRRPPATVPSVFKERPSPESTLAAEWHVAQPSDDAIRAKWWEAFRGSAPERARGAGRHFQSDGRAGRGAVPGRPRGHPHRACGLVPDGHGRRLCDQVALVVDARRRAASPSARSRTISCRSTSGTRPTSGAACGAMSSRASPPRRRRVPTCRRHFSAARPSWHWTTSSCAGSMRRSRCFESTLTAFERAVQLTKARHDQGVASGVDVAQAQTQLDTTRVQATDLQVARAQFEHAIAILVGKAPADLTIPPAAIDVPPPAVPITLPSQLVERRPDVAAAERRVAAANAQIGVAQAAFFPTLALTASGGLESSTLNDAADVAQPVLGDRSLACRNRVRRRPPQVGQGAGSRQLRRDGGRVSAEHADGVSGRGRQPCCAARAGRRGVQARAAVASANHSLELANNRYVGGVTTYLEVITAQTAALRTRSRPPTCRPAA